MRYVLFIVIIMIDVATLAAGIYAITITDSISAKLLIALFAIVMLNLGGSVFFRYHPNTIARYFKNAKKLGL